MYEEELKVLRLRYSGIQSSLLSGVAVRLLQLACTSKHQYPEY